MTKIQNILINRKSSRAFDPSPLSDDVIRVLQESTQLSASCFNNQPWRFLFLTEKSALERGRDALSSGNAWARKAPLLVVAFSRADLDCQLRDGRAYYLLDLGIAIQTMMLQATELNLVARPMAGFSPAKIHDAFDLPGEFEPYVMLAIGQEGDISSLSPELQQKSAEPRERNPLDKNFFMNAVNF